MVSNIPWVKQWSWEKSLCCSGHSSFLLRHGGSNIYIDPFMLPATDTKADLILITHAHQDHYSPDSIDKIIKSGTKIIASRLCEGIERYPNVKILEPGQSASAFGMKIEACAGLQHQLRRS